MPDHVAPVAHADDDDPLLVPNLVHDPIAALSDAIPVAARELDATGRARIHGELLDSLDHAATVGSRRDVVDVLGGGSLEDQPIGGHAASVLDHRLERRLGLVSTFLERKDVARVLREARAHGFVHQVGHGPVGRRSLVAQGRAPRAPTVLDATGLCSRQDRPAAAPCRREVRA